MTWETSPKPSSRLPGWGKAIVWLVVVAVAVVVLFTWVFPWVESIQQDPTLGVAAGHVSRAPR